MKFAISSEVNENINPIKNVGKIVGARDGRWSFSRGNNHDWIRNYIETINNRTQSILTSTSHTNEFQEIVILLTH